METVFSFRNSHTMETRTKKREGEILDFLIQLRKANLKGKTSQETKSVQTVICNTFRATQHHHNDFEVAPTKWTDVVDDLD